jgi:uncharacterized membrane protein
MGRRTGVEMNAKLDNTKDKKTGLYPFRAAVVRGLGVVVPPLFTIVIFLWVGTTVQTKVLEPVTSWARYAIVWVVSDELPVIARKNLPPKELKKLQDLPVEKLDGFKPVVGGVQYKLSKSGNYVPEEYQDLGNGTAVPVGVYADVADQLADLGRPPTADDIYGRFVEDRYLNPWLVIPCFLSLFILFLYLLGKFIAASVGRFFWGQFERGVGQVPLVNTVYGAVKQVTDLFLQERELEYSRIVAVEWPRKGIWSMALVTGESMMDIEAAANEPVLSVLIPTSPMPMTGFALTVKKSETIDLNISFDQAIQFIVSCGVVVPPGQIRDPQARRAAVEQLAAPDDRDDAEAEE